MKKKYFLLVCFVFFTFLSLSLCYANDDSIEEVNPKTNISISTSLRFQTLQTTLINDYFTDYEYVPMLNTSASGSSYSISASSGNLMLQLESASFMSPEVIASTTSQGITARVFGTFNCFNIGYNAFSLFGFRLYPIIGYGIGETNLSMMKNEDKDSEYTLTTFDQIALTPHSSAALISKKNSCVNFALDINYSNDMVPFVVSNTRIGYLLPIGKSIWTLNNLPLEGGPEFEFGGTYFQFSIGLIL